MLAAGTNHIRAERPQLTRGLDAGLIFISFYEGGLLNGKIKVSVFVFRFGATFAKASLKYNFLVDVQKV